MGQAEKPAFRIGDFDMDPAARRLIHDQPRIGIERIVGLMRHREKLLVDRILPLDGEKRHSPEIQLLIEPDRQRIVVHDRQVDIGKAACLEMFGKLADQMFADARLARLRMHRETPQRSAAVRIVKQSLVVDAGDRADDIARSVILRHEIGQRTVVPLGREEIGSDLDHAASGIDPVDAVSIGFRREPADRDASRAAGVCTVGPQVEPVGVGRVEENLLRRP